jgi:hypothetical protein
MHETFRAWRKSLIISSSKCLLSRLMVFLIGTLFKSDSISKLIIMTWGQARRESNVRTKSVENCTWCGRLNSGSACYHSVQNALSSLLLSKNITIRIYKTIILPVVLYGHETWSLTLREEHRLRVFENRVLRRIFGPKRDEVIGGWRKLHIEELHNLYPSPSIIRMI